MPLRSSLILAKAIHGEIARYAKLIESIGL
jgi:hypothetical protein